MTKVKIDKKLLPMKAHYFLFNAGTAPLMPYIPVYARQLGVSQLGVGLMYTVFPFIGLIAKPTFGALADKCKAGKAIFISAILLTGVFFSCIGFIPGKDMEANINLDCSSMTLLKTCAINDNCTLERINLEHHDEEMMNCHLSCESLSSSFMHDMCSVWNVTEACNMTDTKVEFTTHSKLSNALHEHSCLFFPVDRIDFQGVDVHHPHCSVLSTVNCSVHCDSATVMSYIEKPVSTEQEEAYWNTIQFQMLFGLMVGSWAAQAVVVSIGDSICFNLLGDRPHDFGVQRLWGAVGWGLFGIISGYLIDLASLGKTSKDYTPSFILVPLILIINALSVSKIKIEYHQEPLAFQKVLSLFKDVKVLLFFFSCISFGACIALIWQFLFWFLEDLAGAQGCSSLRWIKLLEGLAMGIQCFAGEAPFLFLSGWFLKKLGHVKTMTLILAMMGIRLLSYSFLVNPWYSLPIELLNGLTLGLYWSTSASYAYLVAPPGAASTLQGILGAIFEGIGTSVGSLLGGLIFQSYGGVTLFRSFGIFALLVAVIFAGANWIIDVAKKPRKDSVAGIEDFSSEEARLLRRINPNRQTSGTYGLVGPALTVSSKSHLNDAIPLYL